MMEQESKPKALLAMPLPPPFSGQETVTEMLLASPLGEQFQIIHLDTSNKSNNVNRGRLDIWNSLATLRNLARLCWLLVSARPDLVNLTMPKNRWGFIKFASLVLPPAIAGIAVITRSGGSHFDAFYNREPGWMQAFIRFVLFRMDAIIVEADRLQPQFLPFLAPERIETVYLGLDPKMFDVVLPLKKRNACANILFIGHVSKAKGALDLLDAIPAIRARHPDTQFMFAGDMLKQERNITFIDNPPDIEKAVWHKIDKLHIGDAISFLGIITGKVKLETFASADIFVLPSYAEGFPFAVLEAMLAGLAVVTTAVGALPEVFEHENHLLFVEPGDVEGIAAAINRLIDNPELRMHLGQTARALVQRQYNLDRVAERTGRVYNNALARRLASSQR